MSCKLDNKKCDSDSLICRLNPNETEPYYFNQFGEKSPLINSKCSNYAKPK